MNRTDQHRPNYGILYGIAAYGLWGFLPLYFHKVAEVAPLTVLAHRALWSFVVLAVLVHLLGRWGELWRELQSGRLLLMLSLSALLIAANWLLFIYAVESHQLVEASLGYFINPLLSVLLGVVFLRERLRPAQMLSIALAAAGVLILTRGGQFPWIAVALALTFGFYGLMRKIMPADGLVSLTVETALMTPLALAYLGYLGAAAATADGAPAAPLLWMMLAGPVTTVPLLFFGAAARRLRLSTLGILQYLAPSLQFLLAVAAFHEPFSGERLLSFAFIWTAIAIYATDSLRAAREGRIEVVEPD